MSSAESSLDHRMPAQVKRVDTEPSIRCVCTGVCMMFEHRDASPRGPVTRHQYARFANMRADHRHPGQCFSIQHVRRCSDNCTPLRPEQSLNDRACHVGSNSNTQCPAPHSNPINPSSPAPFRAQPDATRGREPSDSPASVRCAREAAACGVLIVSAERVLSRRAGQGKGPELCGRKAKRPCCHRMEWSKHAQRCCIPPYRTSGVPACFYCLFKVSVAFQMCLARAAGGLRHFLSVPPACRRFRTYRRRQDVPHQVCNSAYLLADRCSVRRMSASWHFADVLAGILRLSFFRYLPHFLPPSTPFKAVQAACERPAGTTSRCQHLCSASDNTMPCEHTPHPHPACITSHSVCKPLRPASQNGQPPELPTARLQASHWQGLLHAPARQGCDALRSPHIPKDAAAPMYACASCSRMSGHAQPPAAQQSCHRQAHGCPRFRANGRRPTER